MSKQHQDEKFSNQSYMNPLSDRHKYQGRDTKVGSGEAQRRLNSLPYLEEISTALSEELRFTPPHVVAKRVSIYKYVYFR